MDAHPSFRWYSHVFTMNHHDQPITIKYTSISFLLVAFYLYFDSQLYVLRSVAELHGLVSRNQEFVKLMRECFLARHEACSCLGIAWHFENVEINSLFIGGYRF